ncbi:GNAT family N-acetyltransferase [Aeromicrobium ginsengisoli]|uniref:GNAT family N-acetyltransferase n=1 Tax=Aeromicrobium ginsengisoli TaxID=363867 RepID=A0A5M4FIB5_9ACTN|nr:GNAT family N-acetyltransferase [Aeromicrobium ginsengisoli]KAA1399801.1 GNAT family N-acetyltransferase [Aeromicrobium ginsengisoli]
MTVGTEHELIDRWIITWAHARGLETSTVDGWPLVHVRSRTRETELICTDPGLEAFAELFTHIEGDERAMLTVIADDASPYAELALPPGVRVDRDDETLMATTFRPIEVPPLESRFTSRWDIEDHRARYFVEAGDRVAAEGTIGILGEDATFDAVETTPAFQRRGLGRHVMATLTAYALESGARRGVLAASAQGRLLYESLGWDAELDMLSLMGAVDSD